MRPWRTHRLRSDAPAGRCRTSGDDVRLGTSRRAIAAVATTAVRSLCERRVAAGRRGQEQRAEREANDEERDGSQRLQLPAHCDREPAAGQRDAGEPGSREEERERIGRPRGDSANDRLARLARDQDDARLTGRRRLRLRPWARRCCLLRPDGWRALRGPRRADRRRRRCHDPHDPRSGWNDHDPPHRGRRRARGTDRLGEGAAGRHRVGSRGRDRRTGVRRTRVRRRRQCSSWSHRADGCRGQKPRDRVPQCLPCDSAHRHAPPTCALPRFKRS